MHRSITRMGPALRRARGSRALCSAGPLVPPPPAKTKIIVDWGDRCTTWDLLYSLLKWGDSGQAAWYRAPNMPAAVAGLYKVWEKSCVTRVNTLQLLVPAADWPDEADVTVWCSRVGVSSWEMSMTFADTRRPLAHLVSTMVSVDESLVKTKPLPDPEAVRACTRPPPLDASTVPHGTGRGGALNPALAGTTPTQVYQAVTRLVDTDSLRHINNAKYAYLAVEAVHAGLVAGSTRAGSTGGGAAAGGGRLWEGGETGGAQADITEELHRLFNSVETMSIAYTGQLHAGQQYQAHTWQDRSNNSFQVEFTDGAGDESMCFVAFGGSFPENPTRAAKL